MKPRKPKTLPTAEELLRLIDTRKFERELRDIDEREPGEAPPSDNGYTFCCKRCGLDFKTAADLYFDCPQCIEDQETL